MDDLELIEKHIKENKDSVFIRNCISCCEVNFNSVCAGGYVELCKFMIKTGSAVNSALRFASRKGRLEVIKLLLEAGADVNANNNLALGASRKGHLEVVKVLLEAGADVHAEDDYALRRASRNGNLEVVRCLLDAGANVYAFDKYSERWAMRNGHFVVVKLLEDWVKSHE